MIDPSVTYPGLVSTPDANYPYGGAINETSSGALDGTPLEQKWVNDFYGLIQHAVNLAGVVPTNTAETAQASQVMDSLATAFRSNDLTHIDSGGADAKVLTIQAASKSVSGYKNSYAVEFINLVTNTAAVTIDVDSIGAVDLRDSAGAALAAGAITAGQRLKAVYNTGAGHFRLSSAVIKDWITLSEDSLSGADNEWLSVPGGVERIEITCRQVSLDNADETAIQLGGVSYVVAGYAGQARVDSVGSAQWSTQALLQVGAAAANTWSFLIQMRKFSGNIWHISSMGIRDDGTTSGLHSSAGYVDVGAVLQKFKLKASGAGNFDNGTAIAKYFGPVS